eukprot:scaffold50756_cov46-Attheya_sp.AAC.4
MDRYLLLFALVFYKATRVNPLSTCGCYNAGFGVSWGHRRIGANLWTHITNNDNTHNHAVRKNQQHSSFSDTDRSKIWSSSKDDETKVNHVDTEKMGMPPSRGRTRRPPDEQFVMAATTNVADNPCWGGPEPHQHSLSYLLEQIVHPPTEEGCKINNHKPLILYESSHYLVLNKPPDLRMYGAHASTVHKLMTYWYPPPSLLSQQTADTTNTMLNTVASLTNFNDVTDNPIRPCHQLDYATSGVLLFAVTKEAAAAACRAFADRSTQKQYVALVHGHVLPQTILDDLPKISSETFERSFQSNEARYRQVRKKQPTDDTNSVTFQGFMRGCDIFQQWQSTMLKKARQKQSTSTETDDDDAHN